MPRRTSLLVAGIAIALACPAGALGAEPLRAQWHLDEGCGGNICHNADSSGNNLTGVQVGTPVPVDPARFGKGLHFSSEADYVDVGNHPELQPANVTVLTWARADETPVQVKALISQGTAGSCAYSSYSLYSGGSADAAGLRFYVHLGGGVAKVTPPASNSMWDNQWHLVAGTYDGSAVRLYVDGALIGSTPASGPIGYGLDVNNDFIIGGAKAPACVEDTSFNGDLDEVRVYSRALSQAEIQRLAAATGPNPPDLFPDDVPPDPHVTVSTPTPVTGKIMAFDPTASVARLGQLKTFRYDFDNSGTFDASCPPSVPVAYKMFDTPGAKVVNMQAIATNGGIANTQVAVNVIGKRLARSSQVGTLAQLTNVKNFWCGDKSSLVKLDTKYLPPIFTSEVRAVGIDITQGVVPEPPRPSGLSLIAKSVAKGYFSKARPRQIGVGNVSDLSKYLFLDNNREDPADNKIKWLRKGGKTIVRVYASSIVAPNGSSVGDVQMKLYGFSQSRDLPGSPLLADTGPLDVPLGPPFTTHAMRVGYDPVKGKLPVFTFTLPDSWTKGNLALLAVPVLAGRRLDRQCETLECALSRQAKAEVLFADTGVFFVRAVAMKVPKDKDLPAPADVFKDAFNLTPVGAFATPYQATLDIEFITSCKGNMTFPKPCGDPAAKPDPIPDQSNNVATAVIGQWATDNQAAPLGKLAFVTLGVHDRKYPQLNGYAGWPGKCANGPSGGAICESLTNTPVGQVNEGRPLTSVAHEMFHGLGRDHADKPKKTGGCGGDGAGVPDTKGHIQAIGLDRRPGSGGSVAEPYKVISPDLPGGKAEWYDLMSYCANNNPDDDSWLSAVNWDAVAGEWVSFLAKPLSLKQRFQQRAVTGPALQVSGYTVGGTTQIFHVEPAPGGGAVGPADSPYRIVSRDAAGKAVGNTPLTVQYGHADGKNGDVPTPITTFTGAVPATGAQQLEVISSGQPATTLRASSNRPKVTLLSPKRGSIGRGKTVRVRWRATDADGGPRVAYVDYSVNGGRTYRNVFIGPDKGSALLPSRYFTGASNARIAVRINDGFNQTSVVSGRLRAAGVAPAVTIVNPRPNQRAISDSSLYLRGYAFDDAFKRLSGARLRWFVGRKAVGRGEAVTVTDLPPGRPRIRLVARDRRGRTASAGVRLRVTAAAPFFTTLTPPKGKLSTRARSVRLRIASNVTATLRAGGRTFRVNRRTKRITVPVNRGTKNLKLALALRSHGKSASRTLQIPR